MSKIQILSHVYTGRSLAIAYLEDGRMKVAIVENTHFNWPQVEKAYRAGKYEQVLILAQPIETIKKGSHGRFTVKGNKVLFDGQEAHGYLFERIVHAVRNRLDFDRLLKFAENLYANPSKRAIEELYKFLEHKDMPITKDGCFLAYKGVDKDYYSITGGDIEVIKGTVKTGGHIFNGIGEEIIVKRADVVDDANQVCAKGLHVGSYDYANNFKGDGHLVVVKVNPRDAVSVPHDCSCAKLRACRYIVVDEGKKLSDVRDINFDQAAAVRYHNKRNALGQFAKAA